MKGKNQHMKISKYNISKIIIEAIIAIIICDMHQEPELIQNDHEAVIHNIIENDLK